MGLIMRTASLKKEQGNPAQQARLELFVNEIAQWLLHGEGLHEEHQETGFT